ncbi:unnamed protein product [Moneuplotes crassus]|uniref:Uncharacterized protein n=1 Tax=Euplotes crassus TaxID=5936 RepID=A0AAD1UP59_EUPCR|nr:unnamed protein product [Moneuplotes crassus]
MYDFDDRFFAENADLMRFRVILEVGISSSTPTFLYLIDKHHCQSVKELRTEIIKNFSLTKDHTILLWKRTDIIMDIEAVMPNDFLTILTQKDYEILRRKTWTRDQIHKEVEKLEIGPNIASKVRKFNLDPPSKRIKPNVFPLESPGGELEEDEYTCREMEVFQAKDHFKGISEDKLHLCYIEKIEKVDPTRPTSKYNREKLKLKEISPMVMKRIMEADDSQYQTIDWEFYFAEEALDSVIKKAKEIAKNKGFNLCETSSKCLYTNELKLQCTKAEMGCQFELIYFKNDVINKYEMHDCKLLHNHVVTPPKHGKYNLATKRVSKKVTPIEELEKSGKYKNYPLSSNDVMRIANEAIQESLSKTKDSKSLDAQKGDKILVKERLFPTKVNNLEDLLGGSYCTAYIKEIK